MTTGLTVAAWVLIVWTTAMDGAPNLPITIEPGLDLATCRKKAAIAELTPNTQAVCRPMLKVKP